MAYLKFDDQQARRKAERLRAEEEKEAQGKRLQKEVTEGGKKGRKKRKAAEEGTEDEASTVSESPFIVLVDFHNDWCGRVHLPFPQTQVETPLPPAKKGRIPQHIFNFSQISSVFDRNLMVSKTLAYAAQIAL